MVDRIFDSFMQWIRIGDWYCKSKGASISPEGRRDEMAQRINYQNVYTFWLNDMEMSMSFICPKINWKKSIERYEEYIWQAYG